MIATAHPSPGRPLPRAVRLPNSAAFDYVFAAPTHTSDRYFTVLTRRRSDGQREASSVGARLGLAISKRCAPGAVTRNRIKRIVRESFRHNRENLPAVDLVLLCRRAAADASNTALRSSLDAHWDRLAI